MSSTAAWYTISEQFAIGWLSFSRYSFVTSFVTSVACSSPAVADQFERNSLLLLAVKKNVLIRWLLTLFKSAKKIENTLYALCTHFTQAPVLMVGYSPFYYY